MRKFALDKNASNFLLLLLLFDDKEEPQKHLDPSEFKFIPIVVQIETLQMKELEAELQNIQICLQNYPIQIFEFHEANVDSSSIQEVANANNPSYALAL